MLTTVSLIYCPLWEPVPIGVLWVPLVTLLAKLTMLTEHGYNRTTRKNKYH